MIGLTKTADIRSFEICMQLLSSRTAIVLSVLMLFAINAKAAETKNEAEATLWEVGFKGGQSFNDKDESFEQFEVLLNYRLPWNWDITETIDIGMRATSTAGVLDGGGETGGIFSLGRAFVLFDNHDFNVRIGSAATYMTKDVYGEEDLGTHFQFTSHGVVTYRLWKELSACVRVQHMSNASLSDENPGVNMLMFGLHYAF